MNLLGGGGWGEICSLHMQLFTNTGNSKCEPSVGPQYTVLPHTAQPENAKDATPQSRERSVMSSGSLFLPSLDFLGT